MCVTYHLTWIYQILKVFFCVYLLFDKKRKFFSMQKHGININLYNNFFNVLYIFWEIQKLWHKFGFLFVRVNIFGSLILLNPSVLCRWNVSMKWILFWYKYCFLKIVILDTLKTNSARNTNELLKLNSLL